MIEIRTNEESVREVKILVLGAGGGGGNAVERMISLESERKKPYPIDYAVVNTDEQILRKSKAPIVLQIGKRLTKGFGAGGDSSVGEAAAIESQGEIQALVQNYDCAILIAGEGGGSGTGALPIIAQACKEKSILSIAIVTLPFSFEGSKREKVAKEGLDKLKNFVDTLLVIKNDKLLEINQKMNLQEAFQFADKVLVDTISSLVNIIYGSGIVNLDFSDLRSTLEGKGIAHLAIGKVPAGESILKAVEMCINSPLLETTLSGATHLLVNTSGSINLVDLNEAIQYLKDIAGEECSIIWGTVNDEFSDEGMEDFIEVTLIATGMQEEGTARVESPITRLPAYTPPEKSLKTNLGIEKIVVPKVIKPAEMKLEIPPFLQNRQRG